jgi:hypothetical protein
MALPSSSDDDADDDDESDDGARRGGPPTTPLFPELAYPNSSDQSNDPPTPMPPSYDEAADALQGLRSGERRLSPSEEIRRALERSDGGDGLAAAAAVIRRAMGKGGAWYDGGDDDAEDRSKSVSGWEEADEVDTGGESRNGDDVMPGSSLTSIDFLLGKMKESDTDNDP